MQRYYEAFEGGAMDAEDMGERVKELRLKKKGLEGELANRTTIQELPAYFSRPKYIEQIRGELRGIFANSNQHLKKRYLRILLEDIVVDGKQVTVKARNAGIIAALETGGGNGNGGVAKVISSCNKWQPLGGSNPCDGTENLGPEDRALLLWIRGGVERHLPGADVLLCGSAARGERRVDSDYDILVLSDGPVTSVEKNAVRGAMLDIELGCGSVISVLFAEKGEWNGPGRRAMPFYREVARDAILL